VSNALIGPAVDLSVLVADAELTLMRKLDEFGEVVELASRELSPYKLTRYAEDLAATFHQFYAQCRVVDPEQPELTSARLFAADATRRALRCVLALLGVNAPESM
jgi:arginyl-tRNA synthetase